MQRNGEDIKLNSVNLKQTIVYLHFTTDYTLYDCVCDK